MLYDKRASLGMVLLIDLIIGLLGYTARYTAAILQGHDPIYAHPAALSVACTVAIGALLVHVSLWIGLTLTVVESRPAEGAVRGEPLAAPGYDNDTNAWFRPNIAFLPMPGGRGVAIHVTAEQLTVLRRRVIGGKLGLPINGLEKFSSTQATALRQEAVAAGLTRTINGNQMEWTPEAARAVVRSSPSALIKTGEPR